MAIRQLQLKRVSADDPETPTLPNLPEVAGDLSLTYPNANDTLKGFFKAYATSATATKVEFYFDSKKIDTSFTYQPNNSDLSSDQSDIFVNDGFNTASFTNGAHQVKAVAYYSNNTIATRTVSVNVNNAEEPAIASFTTVLSTNWSSSGGNAMPAGNPGVRTEKIFGDSTSPYTPNGSGTVSFTDEKRRIASNTEFADDARIFIPVGLNSSDPVAVVWFIHANNGNEDTLNNTGHKWQGMIAVANGAIAIAPNLGGSLYSHPDAQRILKNAYKYLSSRFNIKKNYLRSTSGGGAVATLAFAKDMIPNLKGLFATIGVYDVEEDYGGSINIGVWADSDKLSASDKFLLNSAGYPVESMNGSSVPFGKDKKFASRHNPARLTRNHFAGKNIYLAGDASATPTRSQFISQGASGPGDPIVDFQGHAAMFKQNITGHGGPQPASFVMNIRGKAGHSDTIPGLTDDYFSSIQAWGGFDAS
jgi:hypothetical protein